VEDMPGNSPHGFPMFPFTQIVPYPLISNGTQIKRLYSM
jgi:hypothetical protein